MKNSLEASPRWTPISKLSNDILFSIFSINSRMELVPFNKESGRMTEMGHEENTLTTNRYSSQVCRRWRNVILPSPSIWANSLNIDELNQPGDEWRSTVLERTGNAPISLIGRVVFANSSEGNYATSFVLYILEHEWDRIRYLSLCGNDGDIPSRMLTSLGRPAPNLEHLLYLTHEEMQTPVRGEILFSNISPKLTFFCSSSFIFDFNPRLSNLRQLWLMGYPAEFTSSELYPALQHSPLLEELFIGENDVLARSHEPLGNDLSLINLPRLAAITIKDSSARFIADLLKYIVPAPGCRLVVSRTLLDGLNEMDIANLGQVYSTFIRNIADFQPVQYIRLSYTKEGIFAFRAATGPPSIRQTNSDYPYLMISFAYSELSSNRHDPLIFKALSVPIMKALALRPDLGHISKLDLKLDEGSFALSDVNVLAILRQLKSVEELTADLPTLRILIYVQVDAGFSILPSMTTLIVTRIRGSRSPKDYLFAFLKGRMDQGIPVQLINLSKNDYAEDGRWNFLEEIQGLSVVWANH